MNKNNKHNKYNQLKILYEDKESFNKLKDLFNYYIFSKGINVDFNDMVKNFSDVQIYAALHQLYTKKFGEENLAKLKKAGLNKSSVNRSRIMETIIKNLQNFDLMLILFRYWTITGKANIFSFEYLS